MTLQLPGNFSQLPNTLELLYQINGQSVSFLIWIKMKFWPDLSREALKAPFTVKNFWAKWSDT